MLENVESVFVGKNLFKAKWIVCGCYHPPSQDDQYFFNHLDNALDKYTQNYDRFLLIGDFNAEDSERCLSEFLHGYNAENIVKEKTCFKSLTNPSCIDLLLTNVPSCIQNACAITTGLSDFHKMVIALMKMTFQKNPPKEFYYRDYKKFYQAVFKGDLEPK